MAKIVTFVASAITNLPLHHSIRLADVSWTLDLDSLEYHNTDRGAQIVGAVTGPDGSKVIGLWYKNGEAVLNTTTPNLVLEDNTPEPVAEDLHANGTLGAGSTGPTKTIYVNIYHSDETAHGFTIGSKTDTSKVDMEARGQRNTSGNYIATVPLTVGAEVLDKLAHRN